MAETSIEWTARPGTTGRVWNPIRGCSRVSVGCMRCYAERVAYRFGGEGQPYAGLTKLGARNQHTWTGEVRFVPEMLAEPLTWRKPSTVFVNSMSDLFHEKLDTMQIAAVFGIMAACPQHTFIILTKRARRMRDWFVWAAAQDYDGMRWTPFIRAAVDHGHLSGDMFNRLQEAGIARHGVPSLEPWPLPNVWLGVSTENQATADERIPMLLQTPAAVRFISAEPLLGPIDLRRVQWPLKHRVDVLSGGTWELKGWGFVQHSDMTTLDWVIVGGESGPDARPMHPDWPRAIVEHCADSHVPAFVKQLGAWRPRSLVGVSDGCRRWGTLAASGDWAISATPWNGHTLDDSPEREEVMVWTGGKGAEPSTWPAELRVQQWPGELTTAASELVALKARWEGYAAAERRCSESKTVAGIRGRALARAETWERALAELASIKEEK